MHLTFLKVRIPNLELILVMSPFCWIKSNLIVLPSHFERTFLINLPFKFDKWKRILNILEHFFLFNRSLDEIHSFSK